MDGLVSLVQIQSQFLRHVADLITKAHGLGFMVTGGELYRTKDQQQLYFMRGLSHTMNSQHMKRLAIDLNFFMDGDLTYDKADIQAVGDYWESLHPQNRWGGNWTSFLDTNHFERREADVG